MRGFFIRFLIVLFGFFVGLLIAKMFIAPIPSDKQPPALIRPQVKLVI